MLFENKKGILINCQKIDHSMRGVSVVKINVSHNDRLNDFYALMPQNANYSNEHVFFKSILEPIIEKYKNNNEDISLSFSKGFPLLEAIVYKNQNIDTIKDTVVVEKINEIKEILENSGVILEGYSPLKDDSNYLKNKEFEALKNTSSELSLDSFNTVVLENNFIRRFGTEKTENSVNILMNKNKDGEEVCFIDFLDAKGKINNKKIIKFKNKEDKVTYFTDFFKKLEGFKQSTRVFNNDRFFMNFKSDKMKIIKKQLNNTDEKILRILENRKIVNFYDGKEYLPSIAFRILNEKVDYERSPNRINIYAPLANVRNRANLEKLKEDFNKNEIRHFLIGRIEHNESENIFALVTECEKDAESGVERMLFKKFTLDLKAGETDEEVFRQFDNLCESKLGKKLSEFKTDRTQLTIDNFEGRPEFIWSMKEKLNNNVINLSFEESSPYIDIFENYITENESNIEKRNKLLASNYATDENTLCIYADASMLRDVKDSMTYGAIIREPNGDAIIKEIKGIKEYKDHMNDTIAAEEVAIIETLKSIKIMMDREELSKDLNLEFRVDNIHSVENFFEKNGRDEKIVDYSSSDLYSEKEINKLLSYFNKIDFRWTRSHCNNEYNERVDKVAKSAWKLQNSYGYRKDKHKKVLSETNEMFEDVVYKNELSKSAKLKNKSRKKRNNYGV